MTDTWLSDNIDYFPSDLPDSDISLEVYEETPTMKERKSLSLLISDQEELSETTEVVLSGKWKNNDGITFTISSALIDANKADDFAFALMIQKSFHNYLPIDNDDFKDHISRHKLKNPFTAIYDESRNDNEGFDKLNPYGFDGARNWIVPSNSVIDDLSLKYSESDGKKWIAQDNSIVFTSRIWGAQFGLGRHQHTNSGFDFKGAKECFLNLLRNKKKSLIVLIRSEKYLENKISNQSFINKSAVVIMSANGKIRAVQKLPKRIKDAANKMSEYHRCNIWDCYDLVLKNIK